MFAQPCYPPAQWRPRSRSACHHVMHLQWHPHSACHHVTHLYSGTLTQLVIMLCTCSGALTQLVIMLCTCTVAPSPSLSLSYYTPAQWCLCPHSACHHVMHLLGHVTHLHSGALTLAQLVVVLPTCTVVPSPSLSLSCYPPAQWRPLPRSACHITHLHSGTLALVQLVVMLRTCTVAPSLS